MSEKKSFIFGKTFYIAFVLALLTVFIISSCEKKEKVPEVDPNTLPFAQFFVDREYRIIDSLDGNTYTIFETKNNSSNSNRWKWSRPGSREQVSGIIEFETQEQDTIIKHAYITTMQERRYIITLIAYSDMPMGINPDSTVIYKTFESRPFVQEVIVRKPE
jgi:hypothetical protein